MTSSRRRCIHPTEEGRHGDLAVAALLQVEVDHVTE